MTDSCGLWGAPVETATAEWDHFLLKHSGRNTLKTCSIRLQQIWDLKSLSGPSTTTHQCNQRGQLPVSRLGPDLFCCPRILWSSCAGVVKWRHLQAWSPPSLALYPGVEQPTTESPQCQGRHCEQSRSLQVQNSAAKGQVSEDGGLSGDDAERLQAWGMWDLFLIYTGLDSSTTNSTK